MGETKAFKNWEIAFNWRKPDFREALRKIRLYIIQYRLII